MTRKHEMVTGFPYLSFISFLDLGGDSAHRTIIILQKHGENSPSLKSALFSLFLTNSFPSFETMAGAILSHLLEAFIDSASSWVMQGLREAWGADVDRQRENLKIKLSRIQAVLERAEEQQFKSEAVRCWLRNLKDVALDAEDLVEEIEIEAEQSRSAESGSEGGKKRKRGWDFSSFIRGSSSRWDLANRIRQMKERLDGIEKQITDLSLESIQRSKQLEIIRGERRLVSSVRDESSQFLGRTEDAEQIMKLLMSDDDSSNTKFSVIGIVGMGGVGKTTLAQVVYNEKAVTEKFEVKAWVCVSDHFDVERLTKEIIADASKSTSDLSGKSWNSLQCCLRDIVKEKKYLVVLDDVWSEDSSDWERLQPPFTFGARGSRILVTTRSRAVLNAMQATWTHDLMGLSPNDCRSLFLRQAFKDEEERKTYPKLSEIGEKLVKKCGGLPLAAKAVGGLLAYTRQEREWENILKSRIWNLGGSAGNILPALRLSYQHLPAHLKRCFTFCSVFPKDYQFKEAALVKMWIAHGFIREEAGKEIEDTGSEYFNDLLLRSFFQTDLFGYKMHDLVHDLAQFISGHECFEEEQCKSHDDPSKIRHFQCNLRGPIVGENRLIDLEPFYESTGLRTLLVLNRTGTFFGAASLKLPPESFERLRFIRVLDLSWTGIRELPNSIGNLKLLRYLNLSFTGIEELPESICSNYSIKTLLLRGCSNLKGLPNEMRKLICLRHLDLGGCPNIISMPPEIGRLVCLQELPLFVVSSDRRRGIAELKELRKIRGRLRIVKLENVADSEDAGQANLKNKPFIDKLVFEWSENRIHNSLDQGAEEEIANGLQPHPNMKIFRFKGYRGTHFPRWMMNVDVLRLFSNLHTLVLHNCRRCSILPPLGCLPSLSVVRIVGMNEVKQMVRTVCGAAGGGGFPSLKQLQIWDMFNLVKLEGDFPCLEVLSIFDCPQLRQIINTSLPKLKDLKIHNVHNLEQLEGDFPCLEVLSISNYPRLRQMISTSLPKLKNLDIQNVHNLEQLEGDFPCLEVLSIFYCPQLRQIINTSLPKLKDLKIHNVHNLEQLEGDFPCLEVLSISDYPRLRQMISTSLPKLKNLNIKNLHNLEQLEGDFPCLEVLSISDYSQLRQIISTSFPKLKNLDIGTCEGLEALPLLHSLNRLSLGGDISEGLLKSMAHLTSLSFLTLSWPNRTLPRGTLQPLIHLKILEIKSCAELVTLLEEENGGFQDEHHHLPSTLTVLRFSECPNLQSLPRGLHALTSLQTLIIEDCPGMMSLSEEGLPNGLQTLRIRNCPAELERHVKEVVKDADWPRVEIE